jgi:hypothetical protein
MKIFSDVWDLKERRYRLQSAAKEDLNIKDPEKVAKQLKAAVKISTILNDAIFIDKAILRRFRIW